MGSGIAGNAGNVSGGEQEALGGLDPGARVGEAGVSADGVDDAHGRGLDAVDTFEKMIEDCADVMAAEFVEACCAGVTIDHGPLRQLEELLNGGGAVPVDEQLLDSFPVRMMANGAFAAVTLEIGRRRRGWNSAGLGGAKTPLDVRGSSSSHGSSPQD
ncbi:MAG TPA: hypothetical protein VGT03_01235 [Candidatus Acidoferrales bacterium]|nr:hypothetical protein [Candidatus Acidoferrales bacterium]